MKAKRLEFSQLGNELEVLGKENLRTITGGLQIQRHNGNMLLIHKERFTGELRERNLDCL